MADEVLASEASLHPVLIAEAAAKEAAGKPALSVEAAGKQAQAASILIVELKRKFHQEDLKLDTERGVQFQETIRLDTRRKLLFDASVTMRLDMKRIVSVEEAARLDVLREIVYGAAAFLDSRRIVSREEKLHCDLRYIVPWKLSESNLGSLTINLSEATLSDTFEMRTTLPLDVKDCIEGTLLDFPFRYEVGSTAKQDLLLTAQGMYDCDALLYAPMKVSSGGKVTLKKPGTQKEVEVQVKVSGSYVLSRIGRALGKRTVLHFRDFSITKSWTGEGQTYSSILSTVAGWTAQIPNHLLNVFIRKDTLYAIQRGYEPNTVDLTEVPHSYPEVSREIVRTVWQSMSNKTSFHTPYWVIDSIDADYYDDLYPTAEVQEEDPKKEEGHKVSKTITEGVVSKVIDIAPDGTQTTTYYGYSGDGRDPDARLETQEEVVKDTDGKETKSKTYYDYDKHYGYVEGRKYRDGEYVGSSVSQAAAGTPTRYAKKEERDRKIIKQLRSFHLTDLNADKIGGDKQQYQFDYKTVIWMNCELRRLNRRIKETVKMDIYNYGHVVDFTDAVVFKGETYHLVRNQISETPTEIKQSLELVRWTGTGSQCSAEYEEELARQFELVMKRLGYQEVEGYWIKAGED